MHDPIYIYSTIIGMAVVTYLARELPFLLLGKKQVGENTVIWLSFVPVSVMSALLLPELLIIKPDGVPMLNITIDNLYIWCGLATFVVSVVFKNFFVTIIFGVVLIALLRFIGI